MFSLSALAQIPNDLGSLANSDLADLLRRAEDEERRVSRRRQTLHARIDELQAGSVTATEVAPELRAALEQAERELSARRLRLHQQIIDLRVERSRRVDHRDLRAVE